MPSSSRCRRARMSSRTWQNFSKSAALAVRSGTCSKNDLEQLERRNAPLALRDDEFGPDLPAQLHDGTPIDVHAEAPFAVDEPSDPAFQPEPFLLIICTRHVVTILSAEADSMSS